MDLATLRDMSISDLHQELKKQEKAKFGLRQGLKLGEIKDWHLHAEAKKTIAQINTILVEKEFTSSLSN